MSTIAPHGISNFNDALATFLTTDRVEGFKPSIYLIEKDGVPTDGLPTIGAGYTLITKNKSGKYFVRTEYKTDFANSNIRLTAPELGALDTALNFAKKELDRGNKNYSFDQFSNLNLTNKDRL